MIKNNLLGKELKSKADNLLITNRVGGFFLYSQENFSKYQGLLFSSFNQIFKTIDRICYPEQKGAQINFGLNSFESLSKKGKQRFTMPLGKDALIYESDINEETHFIFDCREAYDMRAWGRYYEVFFDDGAIIVKYNKKNDAREQEGKEYEIYTAIVSDEIDYKFIGKWVDVEYSFDSNRFDLAVRALYDAFSLKTKKAVIASSSNKEQAVKTAKEVFASSEEIKEELKSELEKINTEDIKNKEIKNAYFLSKYALDSLKVRKEKIHGLYAGLPWFFQFWTRDSALSSKALYSVDKEFAKDLLLFYVYNVRDDGLIGNIFPNSQLDSIDGVGLVFLRIKELINDFSESDQKLIFEQLKKSVNSIMRYHSKDGLVNNEQFETWMDTTYRPGQRVEIQSLFMSMLSLLEILALKFNDSESARFAKVKKNDIIKDVIDGFYKNSMLSDGLEDGTIRPNVFLAYYFYPELLEKGQWEKVFDIALNKLWLDWGGLSTIDKTDVRFCPEHTGSNNRSYHLGDSWYFVNNMAALCLNRVNKEKYKNFIDSIVKASTNEVLNSGLYGFHAELSSAKKPESNGCLAQAWSSALYIELIDEVFKK